MKNIDGFRRKDPPTRPGGVGIPRRPSLDAAHGRGTQPSTQLPPVQPQPSRTPGASQQKPHQAAAQGKNTFDMGTIPKDVTLDDIDNKPAKKKKYRKHWWQFWRRKEGKKPWSRKKKIIVWSLITLLVILLAGLAVFAWRFLQNTGDVFRGNPLQVFQNRELKTDQFGRSNILLFGTSADDPNHPGADLTDSIMVVSVDQKENDAFMFSVPRDLWVKFDQPCLSGYEGKINEVYMCGKDSAGAAEPDEERGQDALRKKVGEVFGMDLQYSVHVNYQVVRDAVEALGGVDIVIESDDPRGILDRNFDWRCNYECYYVNWPNGPATLNGEQALFLAQARNESGGYGLTRGNFDREENQRKIMMAARDKASSIGFLSNPVKVLQLMDSFGDNIRTNFETAEVRTLVSIGQNTTNEKITSISLIDQEPALLTTGTIPATGASIVQPVNGLYDYTGIQAFIRAYQTGSAEVLTEAATIDVLNGSSTPGLAQERADQLTNEGLTVGVIGNTPAGNYGTMKIYDLSGGEKPATKQRIEEIFGISVTSEPLPTEIQSNASFVVVVGQ